MGNHVRERDEQIAKLRAALEAVEWLQTSGRDYCPWCLSTDRQGHDADCQRQAALGIQVGEDG
jgi:hypothetical protein